MSEIKWDEVKRYCDEQIATLHKLLETHQPEHTTEVLRGEIRAFRRILKLEEANVPADPRTLIQPQPHDL